MTLDIGEHDFYRRHRFGCDSEMRNIFAALRRSIVRYITADDEYLTLLIPVIQLEALLLLVMHD